MFNESTKNSFDFLKIDLACADKNKIFSKNYTEFFQIPDSDSENSESESESVSKK